MQFFTGTQHLACSVSEIGLLPVFRAKIQLFPMSRLVLLWLCYPV